MMGNNIRSRGFAALVLLVVAGSGTINRLFAMYGEQQQTAPRHEFHPAAQVPEINHRDDESDVFPMSTDGRGEALDVHERKLDAAKSAQFVLSVERYPKVGSRGSKRTVVTINHDVLFHRVSEFLESSCNIFSSAYVYVESKGTILLANAMEKFSCAAAGLVMGMPDLAEVANIRWKYPKNRLASVAYSAAESCTLLASKHFQKALESARRVGEIASNFTELVKISDNETLRVNGVSSLACVIACFIVGSCTLLLLRLMAINHESQSDDTLNETNQRQDECDASESSCSHYYSCFFSIKSS